MPLTLAYTIAAAHSCLAADFDEPAHSEHLLLDLDLDLVHPIGPGVSQVTGSKVELVDCLEGAVNQMIDLQ